MSPHGLLLLEEINLMLHLYPQKFHVTFSNQWVFREFSKPQPFRYDFWGNLTCTVLSLEMERKWVVASNELSSVGGKCNSKKTAFTALSTVVLLTGEYGSPPHLHFPYCSLRKVSIASSPMSGLVWSQICLALKNLKNKVCCTQE